MAMKRTFSITLILFLFVWAFVAIDHIGTERVKMASKDIPNVIQNLALDGIEGSRGLGNANGGRIDNTAPFAFPKPRGFEPVQNQILNHVRDTSSCLASLTQEEIQFLVENPAIKAQLEEIDRQISELEAMKRGFEARALRQEDQAQRLQFEDRTYLETRRHWELAEENRAKAAKVQEEIDRLQVEKRKLLQSG